MRRGEVERRTGAERQQHRVVVVDQRRRARAGRRCRRRAIGRRIRRRASSARRGRRRSPRGGKTRRRSRASAAPAGAASASNTVTAHPFIARSKAAVRPASPAPTIATRLGLRVRLRRRGEAWRRPSSTQARSNAADADRAARFGAAADGLARMIANAAEHGGKRDEAGVDRRKAAAKSPAFVFASIAADVEMQRARRRAGRRLLLDAAGFPRFDALTVHGRDSRKRSGEASFRRSSPVAERAAASLGERRLVPTLADAVRRVRRAWGPGAPSWRQAPA